MVPVVVGVVRVVVVVVLVRFVVVVVVLVRFVVVVVVLVRFVGVVVELVRFVVVVVVVAVHITLCEGSVCVVTLDSVPCAEREESAVDSVAEFVSV